MPLTRGQIVRSLAGRDQGSWLVVLATKNDGALVADGKHRPLERPKFKKAKHLAATNRTLDEPSLATNRSVIHALRDATGTVGGENECPKRIS